MKPFTEKIEDPFLEDLIKEIVARLPVKSFLRVRSSCRALCDLAHDPIFVDKHLKFSSQRNPCLLLTDNICREKDYNLNTLYFVQSEETPNGYSCNKLNLEIPKFHEFRVMGSCNGLICLVHPMKRYEICLCNPCTGKHIKIPPPIGRRDIPGNIIIGFGLAPMTNKYKVLAIIDIRDSNFALVGQKVCVYTLGDSTWRFKDNTLVLILGQSACKAIVNGALHWVDDANRIVSFDMETEELNIILPPELELKWGKFSLRAFKGKLLLLNTSLDDCIEIWVMNSYPFVDSWSPIFTVHEQNIGRSIRNVEIVCFLEGWEVYMVYDHGTLLRHNLQTGSVSELVGIDGLPKWFDAVAHVGTLKFRLGSEELEK